MAAAPSHQEPEHHESTADPELTATIAANLSVVRSRIARAAQTVRRDPGDIRLIAVSKTFGFEHVHAAVAAGQNDFGENRVQEAMQKIDKSTELGIRWHLVGHLQSNKAKKAVTPFAWIHSVDSLVLLRRLEAAAYEQGAVPNLMIQVALGGEPTKHGASPNDVALILEAAKTCHAVRICGLMLIPPLVENPEQARPHFKFLRELQHDLLATGVDPHLLQHLSMGMSHDLEIAVEEGATMVRVGRSIFGKRPPPSQKHNP